MSCACSDLKPENVLLVHRSPGLARVQWNEKDPAARLTNYTELEAVLCDFGLTHPSVRSAGVGRTEWQPSAVRKGTPGYMPLEVLVDSATGKSRSWARRSDVWCFGLVAYYILCSTHAPQVKIMEPLSRDNKGVPVDKVMEALKITYDNMVFSRLDDSEYRETKLIPRLKEHVTACLHPEYTKRPRIEDVLRNLIDLQRDMNAFDAKESAVAAAAASAASATGASSSSSTAAGAASGGATAAGGAGMLADATASPAIDSISREDAVPQRVVAAMATAGADGGTAPARGALATLGPSAAGALRAAFVPGVRAATH